VTLQRPRAIPTWEQPRRTVLRRWREAGTTWVELECGHDEPATGWDLATVLRCRQCNPIPRGGSDFAVPTDGGAK
jgi:hypothetical protein